MSTKKPPAKSPRALIISMLIGGIAGYAGVALGMKTLPQWFDLAGFRKADLIWLLAMMPLSFFLAIAVHELGHLVAALAGGFRFRVLTLGPWSIIATRDRWQFRFSPSALALLSGQQISSPPAGGASDRQFVVYLLGGGMANLLHGALALWCASALAGSPVLVANLLVFAFFNLFLGVLNLLPLSTQAGVRTDGHQIRALLRGGDNAVRFRALFDVVADMYAGVRPRDWSRDVINALGRGDVNELELLLAHLVRLQAGHDRGDIDEAARAAAQIEAHYEHVPVAMRGQYAAELAYFFGVVIDDAAKARRYADDILENSYLISPATVHRGRAAALFAEGRLAEAMVEISHGLSVTGAATSEFDRVMEPEWLGGMQAMAEKRQAAASERSLNA